MPTPYEIIAGPIEAYLAPTGEAFPAISAAAAGNWALLGSSGSKNYDEGGVLVRSEQTVDEVRTLGATGPRKAFRSAESLIIEFTVFDARIETYAKILNDAAMTTDAGPPGHKRVSLLQGRTVKLFALFLRGVDISPYGDTTGWHTQWEVPIVYQGDNPESVYVKGAAVGLKVSFRALQDDTSGFGVVRARHAT